MKKPKKSRIRRKVEKKLKAQGRLKKPGLSGDRNFNDPRYTEWRIAVLKRDGYKCVMCGAGGLLRIHHIRKWSDYPTLRFSVQNGCALCQKDHVLVTGKEDIYAPLLMRIIAKNRGNDGKEEKDNN